MMMKEINPPLSVITPKGKARAFWIIDYHFEDYLYFVCFLDETGECWTYDNREVRLPPNITAGRTYDNGAKTASSEANNARRPTSTKNQTRSRSRASSAVLTEAQRVGNGKQETLINEN